MVGGATTYTLTINNVIKAVHTVSPPVSKLSTCKRHLLVVTSWSAETQPPYDTARLRCKVTRRVLTLQVLYSCRTASAKQFLSVERNWL